MQDRAIQEETIRGLGNAFTCTGFALPETHTCARVEPKPAGKMAMVNTKTGEVLEVVKELSPGEEKQRSDLLAKMKAYAQRYAKKHPNVKPERLKKIVSKKFNVKLT